MICIISGTGPINAAAVARLVAQKNKPDGKAIKNTLLGLQVHDSVPIYPARIIQS